MKRIFVGTVAIAGLALTAITPVKAHMTELEVLFIKADRNGDFVLNKSEFLIVALAVLFPFIFVAMFFYFIKLPDVKIIKKRKRATTGLQQGRQ